MVALLQIMIYLFCVYLVYKGCEIFQIAFVSTQEEKVRRIAMALGILSIIGAVGIGIGAVYVTEQVADAINKHMQNFPSFPAMK